MKFKIAVSGDFKETADKIKMIATGPHRGVRKIIYEKDPKKLVRKLIALIKKEKQKNLKKGRKSSK